MKKKKKTSPAWTVSFIWKIKPLLHLHLRKLPLSFSKRRERRKRETRLHPPLHPPPLPPPPSHRAATPETLHGLRPLHRLTALNGFSMLVEIQYARCSVRLKKILNARVYISMKKRLKTLSAGQHLVKRSRF